MHSWRFYTDYHELLVYIDQANDINKSLQGKHMFFWKVAQVATQLLYVSKSKHGSSIAKASNFFQRNWNPNSLCENPQILNVGQWGGHQCCSLRTSGSPTVQTHSKTTFLHTVRVHPDSFVWGGPCSSPTGFARAFNCHSRPLPLQHLCSHWHVCLRCQPEWLQWAESSPRPTGHEETNIFTLLSHWCFGLPITTAQPKLSRRTQRQI